MLNKLINKMKYLNPDKTFDNKTCSIVMINDTAETTSETLGITPERRDFLYELVRTEFKNRENSDHVEVALKVTKNCKHPNELYFVAGIISEINMQIQMDSKLKSALQDLKDLMRGKDLE